MQNMIRLAASSDRPGNAVPLQSGGGGDNSGGMDGRIGKLEAHVEHILADVADIRSSAAEHARSLADVRERFARLETKVDNLPSKEFVASAVSKGFGLLVTATVLVGAFVSGITLFQAQIKHFLNLP